MKLIRGAEMRYFGQLNDVDVALAETKDGEPFTEETLKELIGDSTNSTARSLVGLILPCRLFLRHSSSRQ